MALAEEQAQKDMNNPGKKTSAQGLVAPEMVKSTSDDLMLTRRSTRSIKPSAKSIQNLWNQGSPGLSC